MRFHKSQLGRKSGGQRDSEGGIHLVALPKHDAAYEVCGMAKRVGRKGEGGGCVGGGAGRGGAPRWNTRMAGRGREYKRERERERRIRSRESDKQKVAREGKRPVRQQIKREKMKTQERQMEKGCVPAARRSKQRKTQDQSIRGVACVACFYGVHDDGHGVATFSFRDDGCRPRVAATSVRVQLSAAVGAR